MKLLAEPIPQLRYWAYRGTPREDEQLHLSPYNYYLPGTDVAILYNTRVNAVAVLSGEELSEYKAMQRAAPFGPTPLACALFQYGFANFASVDERRYMLQEMPGLFQMQDEARQFTILPTQKCNARCFYCFENDVNRLRMDDATAQQLVTFILGSLDGVRSFNLDWFGGEPLMEFDRICALVEQLRSQTDVPFTSSITTNATLFSEERIQIAVESWRLTRASITIDGLRDEHNRRKAVLDPFDAFERTMENVRSLLAHGVYVNLRVHIDKYNVGQLDDILAYLSPFAGNPNFHLFVEKLFMPLQVQYHADTKRYILDEESQAFYRQMMIGMKKYGFVEDYDAFLATRRETSCMASRRDSILIDCDGSLYNCEQEFYDKANQIGNIWSGVAYNKHYFEMIAPPIRGTECEKCLYLPTCMGGCRFTRSLCAEGHRHCMRGRTLTPIAMRLLLDEYENVSG